MGPVFDGAGLNVTAMSYRDQVDIGFMACREAVPDLWRLAAEVPEALAELVKLARDARLTTTSRPRKRYSSSNNQVS